MKIEMPSTSTEGSIPLVPVFREQGMPVSTGQARIWYLSQVQEPTYVYNEQVEVRVNGSLDIPFLERSLNKIIERHETLRTVFTQTDKGELKQVILKPFPIEVPLISVGEDGIDDLVSSRTLEPEISRIALEQGQAKYDLTAGPLFRVCVLQLPHSKQIFLFSFHHIILDGRAVVLLLKEINALYAAELQGLPAVLEDLPVQCADYARWEQQWMETEKFARRLDYWKKQLQDLPPLLDLPVDYPRPAQEKFYGAWEYFKLSKKLTKKLLTLSWQERVAPYVVILAAYKTLLMRYTREEDIAVGTITANRPHGKVKELLGFFAETVVLRSNLSGGKTFKCLLQELSALSDEAFHKQAVPFSKLVEVLRLDATVSSDVSPVQAALVFDSLPFDEDTLAGKKISHRSIRPMGISKFDISLSLDIVDGNLKGYVEYNTDLLKPHTVRRFLQHYRLLLESVIKNTGQNIATIPILTEKERQQILIDWNATKADFQKDKCIHQLFETQVELRPNATAIIFEGQQLTYQELNKKSNQLANYLIDQGVVPEVRVGLCVDRSLEMVIGMLGILKAGGAYVPIDPEYPQQRIEYLLADSNIVLLLTQEDLSNTVFTQRAVPCFCLDRDWPMIRNCLQSHPGINIFPLNPAYVIYTSGSTGKPKGVMLNHASLLNHMVWMQREFNFSSDDLVLQKTPLSFDASVWEWALPLMTGARLLLANKDGHRDPDYLLGLIAEHRVTVIQVVPSMLKLLLNHDNSKKMRSLRYLFSGGEALSISAYNTFKELNLRAKLCNLYGPTEATIDSTFWLSNAMQQRDTVPIGRPINNAQLYILDRQLNPVPDGVIGELYIGGDGLARGYLNRPNLTAEYFIPNSFSEKPGGCLYRTRDLVRYLADGNIEYVGRIDHQVKVRGFRIELGEVESALTTLENVREAVVLAHSGDVVGENNYLAAYIVCNQKEKIDQSVLRDELKTELPNHMVPTFFIFLDELPLTPNGKVDRKALPKPDTEALQTQEYVTPRTKIEQDLVSIWAEILKLPADKIGIYDNFFDLGGHSLLATRVISCINGLFNTALKISHLSTAKSIEALASLIAEQLRNRQLTKSLTNKKTISESANREEISL